MQKMKLLTRISSFIVRFIIGILFLLPTDQSVPAAVNPMQSPRPTASLFTPSKESPLPGSSPAASPTAVSYTHLDVYKRQGKKVNCRMSCHGSLPY